MKIIEQFRAKSSTGNTAPFIYILVGIILLVGFGLRVAYLGDIYSWNDETDNFDEQIYDQTINSLRRYAAAEAQELTLGPAWPILISLTCRVFGETLTVGRMVSVVFGTLMIPLIFFLVYWFLRINENKRYVFPAVIASVLSAISIIQIVFSQWIIPYSAVPFLSTGIIIAHLKITTILKERNLSIRDLLIWSFLYALVCGFSVYLHLSVTMILFGSFVMLAVCGYTATNRNKDNRVVVFGILALAFLAVLLAWVGNAIHTQSGYRYYLAPYYHKIDFGAIPFLISRGYDLLTYNLNLFYNESFYWPRRINPVLIPLIIICLLGWLFSACGRLGRTPKHLSYLAIISLLVTASLSLIMKYPFGGVRQTLFMSPFIFTFTALGFWILSTKQVTRYIALLILAAYLILWAFNLPDLYRQRIVPYTSQELVSTWEKNGKHTFYVFDGSKRTFDYALQENPMIKIENIYLNNGHLPDPPFFLISTYWSMENSLWMADLKGKIKKAGYFSECIMLHEPAYTVHSEYRQSLYFPSNGLWIYKVTKKEKGDS